MVNEVYTFFKKEAKKRDDGKYAMLGMMHQCASYFNVDINSQCVKEIVETYLECINTFSFEEWIRGANPDEQVVVMDKEYLKENFNDLLTYSDDLEILQNMFMHLYDQEMWIDIDENVLYSTTFNLSLKKRAKFNFVGIAMEYERLCVLDEEKIVGWKNIDSCVECIALYGYDFDKDYEYRTNDIDETVNNIIERLKEIFPL